MSRNKAIFAILFLTVTFCTSLTLAQNISGTRSDPSIQCRLDVDGAVINPHEPYKVRLSITSQSEIEEVLKAITIMLNETPRDKQFAHLTNYYAPVDIKKEGALEVQTDAQGKQVYPEQHVALPIHTSINFTIPIRDLYWANSGSSLLPSVELFHAVKSGNYDLSARVRLENGNSVDCGAHNVVITRK